MRLDGLAGVKSVAKFLGTPEDKVMELAEESRLGGAIVNALRSRGVPVTPKLKNSVETVVRTITLAPTRSAAGLDGANGLSSELTVTIMFTDVVDSTAMTDRLGDKNARAILRVHDRIVRGQTKAHGGSEVKSMGDGFMLTFPSAKGGVACALAIQRDMAKYNNLHPKSPLRVRIGLAVGEPVQEEGDFFGASVNQAARISAEAGGGQVLVSQVVHGLVARSEDFEFEEVGQIELKGFSDIQTVYEVVRRT